MGLIFLGTPITRHPVLGNQDLDLHKLYKIVQEHGGMEKVTIVHYFCSRIQKEILLSYHYRFLQCTFESIISASMAVC